MMFRYISLLLIIALYLECSPPVGGTSTETTNTFHLSAEGTSLSGTTTPGSIVKLIKSDYIPINTLIPLPDSTIANENGAFQFSSVSEDIYNIISSNKADNQSVFIVNLNINANSKFTLVDTLRKSGTIRGKLAADTVGNRISTVAFLKGTTFMVDADTDDRFVLNHIPRGNYILAFNYHYSGIMFPRIEIPNEPNVTVEPDSIVDWDSK
jgi:hypothetical protein